MPVFSDFFKFAREVLLIKLWGNRGQVKYNYETMTITYKQGNLLAIVTEYHSCTVNKTRLHGTACIYPQHLNCWHIIKDNKHVSH